MIRFVAYAVLFMAAIVGAGWVYQVHHLTPANFDHWPTLKAIRDLTLVGVALAWLFRPSRVIIAVVMLAAFVAPFLVGQRPPDLFYGVGAATCIALAVLATHLRRHVPSPFANAATSTPD